MSVGRKTRLVPAALKRALRARDKGCRFPGCGRRRFVDAHHVVHWSAGGETSLDNLLLLCSSHHALVHEGGFSIAKDYRDRWFFRRPDGRAVPACGYRPEDMSDGAVRIEAEYARDHTSAEVCSSEGIQLTQSSLAEVHSAEAPMVREPSVKVYRVASLIRGAVPPRRATG